MLTYDEIDTLHNRIARGDIATSGLAMNALQTERDACQVKARFINTVIIDACHARAAASPLPSDDKSATDSMEGKSTDPSPQGKTADVPANPGGPA